MCYYKIPIRQQWYRRPSKKGFGVSVGIRIWVNLVAMQLAAAVLHWDPIYEKVLKDVAANKWTNAPIYYGVKEGTVNVENIGKAVSADAKKMVLARRDAIKAGKLNPFAGPLYTQAGKEFVKAGSIYTEAQLDKMNFYVQGVQAYCQNKL
jgi:simple sugar transport system substrate-binding protein